MAKHQKPLHQKIIIYSVWTFGGVLALGTVLDAVSNALSLITKPVAIISTIILLCVWFVISNVLKRYPLLWVTENNKRIRIKKLGLRYSLPLLGMILLIWLPVAWNAIQELAPASLEFEKERPNETLIVIATFYRTEGVADAEAHHEIQRAIEASVDDLGLQDIRVQVESSVLRSESRELAEELGNRYEASMVIWGMETAVRVTVNFLNLKESKLDTRRVFDEGFVEISHVKPEAYVKFITRDLPGELSFLTLFAISHAAPFHDDFAQNYAQRIALLYRAIEELPDDIPPPEGAAFAYFNLGSLLQGLPQTQEEALEAYNHALLLKPDLGLAYYNRAGVKMALGDMEGSLADYEQGLTLDPDNLDRYLGRGVARYQLSDYDGAYADLSHVIENSSDAALIASAYFNRGGVQAAQGNHQGAISDYTQSLDHDPQFTAELIYFLRAGAKVRNNDYDGAIDDYNLALTLSPSFAIAYIERGLAKIEKGDYEGAMADLNQANRLDLYSAKTYAGRGELKQKLGDLEGAIEDYEQAIVLEPDNPDYLNNRGVARYYLGDIDGAIDDYNLAITIDDSDSKTFNNRGNARADKGDVTGAIEDYNQAILLDSENIRAYFNRGMTFYKQGKFDDAIMDFNQILVRDSNWADAYWGRGLAYRDIGNNKGALDDFRRYLDLNPNADRRDDFEQWIFELEAEINK